MPMTIGRRLDIAASVSGVTRERILGDGRDCHVIQVRHAVMMVLFDAGYAKADIGRFMRRDHHTVIHALKHGRDNKVVMEYKDIIEREYARTRLGNTSEPLYQHQIPQPGGQGKRRHATENER